MNEPCDKTGEEWRYVYGNQFEIDYKREERGLKDAVAGGINKVLCELALLWLAITLLEKYC